MMYTRDIVRFRVRGLSSLVARLGAPFVHGRGVRRLGRLVRGSAGAAAVLLVAVFASGCTAVAPYERGKLAHPTMSAGSLSTMGEDHLHAISEGATGGSGGTGSGCGCN